MPQPETGVTKAPPLRKGDGLIPWERDAAAVHNRIRGMNPWPGSYTFYRGARLRVRRAAIAGRPWASREGGSILEANGDTIVVSCGRGAVRLLELQAEGRKALGAAEFLRGFALEKGEVLGRGVE